MMMSGGGAGAAVQWHARDESRVINCTGEMLPAIHGGAWVDIYPSSTYLHHYRNKNMTD